MKMATTVQKVLPITRPLGWPALSSKSKLLLEKKSNIQPRGLVMGSTFWTVVAIFIAANIPFFGIMSLGVSFFQSLLGFLAPVFPAAAVVLQFMWLAKSAMSVA